MKKNVGKADRIIRSIVGLALLVFGIAMQSWWGLLGAFIMLPAFMGSDPLYSLLGISSKKTQGGSGSE